MSHLSLNGITFTMDDRIRSHNAIGRGVGLDNLELHGPHAPSDEEDVALVYRPVSLQEIWFQVNLK